MKILTLTQDEFIVLAHIMKVEKLILYAGTGLQGKVFTKKLEDHHLEMRKALILRGLISVKDKKIESNKVILNRGIFIFKDKNTYELSDDIQRIKDIATEEKYEIEVLENQEEYEVCINKLVIGSRGYMSIIFDEEAKNFTLEIAQENERLNFFSKHLQIPMAYTIKKEESYSISLKSDNLEKLINAYTANDKEVYEKEAGLLGWDVERSRGFLKSTWENENYRNYVIINSKKKNSISNIRIYNDQGDYYMLKSQDTKKAVEAARKDFPGMIDFFVPES